MRLSSKNRGGGHFDLNIALVSEHGDTDPHELKKQHFLDLLEAKWQRGKVYYIVTHRIMVNIWAENLNGRITFPHTTGKTSHKNVTGRSPGGLLSPFFQAWHPDNQNLPLPSNLYIRN